MINIKKQIFNWGKIFFVCFSFLLIVSGQISAEIYTVINSIEKNGEEINKGEWNNFTISNKDSITFHFQLEGNGSSDEVVDYKIFLTGSSSVPALSTNKRNYYTLKNLSNGDYIFKVQAFINSRSETTPAVIRFRVNNENSLVNSPKKESDNLSNLNSLVSKDMIIILLLLIIIIGLVFTLFIFKSKIHIRNESKIIGKREEKRNENSFKTNSLYTGESIPLSSEESEITEELFDYKYAYENLRKEFDKIKNENAFLKNNIDNLNTNVKDLENANVQLSKQKERLLESKRQLEELQAQKEELFTIALHDIKNPASAIKGFVELLESYDLNANEQQEIMHSLVDTSSKIIELAQQMSVAIAKQTPEPPFSPEKGSIKAITDAVCKRNVAYAKKKGINIINNTSPNTPETLIDVFKIEEVIDNLINNAIKYSPSGTIVYVRSYFNESKITIEVEDNGVGLSEDDLKKAFRKGVILSSKPTGDETRSGLGLWISKKIIEEHGGNIWLKSKLGIGTKVGFDLPIKKT